MRIRDFFPLGMAFGLAFCNRTEETAILADNIKHGKHTLLIATRRYGKSSLALHALIKSGLPYVEADFYMASSEQIIESYILNGVVELIGKALGPIEKLIASIKKYVKHLSPKVNIATEFLQLELTSDASNDPATNVKEALMLLENMLAEKKQQAVFLMDEFQNVGVIAQGKGIEAAIRHVAQKTKYLTIIFSGSNRQLLQTMFEDENRPLYKLCWKISLQRISADHYRKHIQKISKKAWGKELSENVIDEILMQSERHPFYLNKLCDRLLTFYSNAMPSVMDVRKEWTIILEEEKSDAIKEISTLSLGQKTVLLQIARYPQSLLTSKQVLQNMDMSSSSALTALNGLEEKDVIERIESHYQIINPVVRFYALKSGNFSI